ncbi:MAG: hypothetical protein K6E20_01815 [Acholeplasmatales bacterium]|nr:hypothetical protein [Acholeplasmatales bacterium]
MSRKTFSFILTALALALFIIAMIFLTLDCGKLTIAAGPMKQSGTISGYDAIFGDSKDQYKFNALNFTTFMLCLVVIALLAVRLVLKFLNKSEKAIKILGIVNGVLALVCGIMLILIPQFATKTDEFKTVIKGYELLGAKVTETIKVGIILAGIASIGAGIFEFVDTFALKLFFGKKHQAELN